MVLGRHGIRLLAVLTAASVSLSSEAGAAVVSGAISPTVSPPLVLAGRSWVLDAFGIPSDRDLYGPCLGGASRVRLRGPHGLRLEPLTTETGDDGVHYVLPPGPSGEPSRAGLITWRDLRGVDVWEAKPRAFSVTTLGGVGGMLAGFAIASAWNEPPEHLSSIPASFAVLTLEALPFGILGWAIGRHLDPQEPGRWTSCEDTPEGRR